MEIVAFLLSIPSSSISFRQMEASSASSSIQLERTLLSQPFLAWTGKKEVAAATTNNPEEKATTLMGCIRLLLQEEKPLMKLHHSSLNGDTPIQQAEIESWIQSVEQTLLPIAKEGTRNNQDSEGTDGSERERPDFG